jgi:hypothetical protein
MGYKKDKAAKKLKGAVYTYIWEQIARKQQGKTAITL